MASVMEDPMQGYDDELVRFEAEGALPLPADGITGYVEHDGARIWYASNGAGPAVILLHGGHGNAGNWGFPVPALVAAGYTAVVVDSRGHGRSTRDARPYSYQLMGEDVLAVMDRLRIGRAAFIGWSDGACTALILGDRHPERVAGVFYFGCNMDRSGTKEFVYTETIGRCLSRHKKDYAALSPTPGDFDAVLEAVGLMQRTQPDYAADDLLGIGVPVTIVQAQHDEFIRHEHADYLARTLPDAALVDLPDVSHFAPLQRPEAFNRVVLDFAGKVLR
jgi:pimeloyl-ACP methyl ester carboxylesterase